MSKKLITGLTLNLTETAGGLPGIHSPFKQALRYFQTVSSLQLFAAASSLWWFTFFNLPPPCVTMATTETTVREMIGYRSWCIPFTSRELKKQWRETRYWSSISFKTCLPFMILVCILYLAVWWHCTSWIAAACGVQTGRLLPIQKTEHRPYQSLRTFHA